MSNEERSVEEITRLLADPFSPEEVKFKPSVVTGSRALAMAYVDARVIQDRLDEVLGVDGWQDDYEVLPDGSVICRLRIRLGGEWVMKVDVGGQSEQKDEGDRMKAAFSDSLKRAAVKFGIGRFLYRLPAQWCDYDPQKRQFVRPPVLPDFARPKQPHPAADAKRGKQPAKPAPAEKPAPTNGGAGTQTRAAPAEPKTPAELGSRLESLEYALIERGLAKPGDPDRRLKKFAADQKFPADVGEWAEAQVKAAYADLRAWKQGLEAAQAKQPA